MSDKCADPFSSKVVQSTAGSILSLWIRRTSNYITLINVLKEKAYYLVSADLQGEETGFKNHNNMILALGNEADGLSREVLDLSDYRLKIPIQKEGAESLNVASAGAILMYLFR